MITKGTLQSTLHVTKAVMRFILQQELYDEPSDSLFARHNVPSVSSSHKENIQGLKWLRTSYFADKQKNDPLSQHSYVCII